MSMRIYEKNPPKNDMQKPEKGIYEKIPPDGDLKKPILEPPPPPGKTWTRVVKKEIQEFVLCPKNCFVNLFGCDTKAYHCPTNCTADGCSCDLVCRDSSCAANCQPNCRCDSHCSYDDDCRDCRLDNL